MQRVMMSYLRASRDQRLLMAAAMPDILTPEVCEELASADDIIKDSRLAASDALAFGDGLMAEAISKADAQMAETFEEDSELAGEDFGMFEEILSTLLSANEPPQAEARARVVTSTAQGSPFVVLPSELLNEVFAFLPIIEIIEVTEHVCSYWNAVTTSSVTAQAFWIGCVHRQYPAQLAALVAVEGDTLFDADWRTIGTMIVCKELIEDDDEETDG
eukprot:GILI01025118.1.p1 GENE.GILI01025118.1~~GILI01025118.1.p1  ORF type:complete len:217 (-),score=34.81 GILI01025118.1:49-699(-)